MIATTSGAAILERPSAPSSPPSPAPTASPTAILATLNYLFAADDVVELRAIFSKDRKRTDCGYYDAEHRKELVSAAANLNKQGAAVYVCMNTIDPQLLSRYHNRLQEWAKDSTQDTNIIRRRWLLLDFDPVRPKDTSATDRQVEAAHALGVQCYSGLRAAGWPDPAVAISGNGYHLLYPIDLPNTPESTELIKGVLEGLAKRFGTEDVKVDRAVFNAARITKLYGTVSNKGDNTSRAPWRVSKLIKTPVRNSVITVDQLRAWVPPSPSQQGSVTASMLPPFDLVGFLSRLGIDYTQDMHDGAERYLLKHCPFNPEHGKGEAAVFRLGSGALVFKCMHNSCSAFDWQALRERVDGPKEQRSKTTAAPRIVNKATPVSGAAAASSEWPEPRPIQAELHPVAEFDPVALLPDALRDWVMDEADRMVCPPDFIAAAVLVALGSLIGARCAVKPKSRDDWVVVPNLWGGVVALPSSKKSPAIDAGIKPINKLIAKAMEEHRAELDNYEAASVSHAAKKEAIENRVKVAAKDSTKGNPDIIAKELIDHRREAPEVPTARRYKSNDATIEKLGELLRENPNGLLVLRDELVGLIASWDREGREGERAFFLESWNGTASFDTDRIGRGSIFIPNLCLSIFGGIQPDKLTAYLEQADNALANDGLLQRFQALVYPDPVPYEWVDRAPNITAREAVWHIFEVLNGFDPLAWGATPSDAVIKFPCFGFSPPAQELFIEWTNELQRVRIPRELLDGHQLIAQHLAKFEKLFAVIALILHLAECAATSKHFSQISEDAAARAASWCEYLESHARRCYGLLIDDGLRSAQALAEKMRQGKLPDVFTARDIRRNRWRYLTTTESILAALDWLEGEGWLRAEEIGGTGPGTGRRTVQHQANPKIQKSSGLGAANGAIRTPTAAKTAGNPGLSGNLESSDVVSDVAEDRN